MMRDAAADGRLVLDGALTVRAAGAICATLREAVAAHSVVSIDAAAATEVDLSFIQLLIASRNSAARLGKTVNLTARPDGVLLSALTQAGFQVTDDDRTGAQDFGTQGYWFNGATE